MKRRWWVIVGAIGMSGCATLFPPPAQQVLLQSQPAGATVSINGEVRGTTPLSLPLSCQPVPMVKMELQGFQSVEHPMPRQDGWNERLGVAWLAEKCAETLAVVLPPKKEGGR